MNFYLWIAIIVLDISSSIRLINSEATCDSFIITNNKTGHHSDSAFNQILTLKIWNYRTIRLDWKVRPASHLSKMGTTRCDYTCSLTSSLTYVFFVLFLFLGSGLIMCVSTSTCVNLPRVYETTSRTT